MRLKLDIFVMLRNPLLSIKEKNLKNEIETGSSHSKKQRDGTIKEKNLKNEIETIRLLLLDRC